jgi:hypothetical protein
MFYPGGFWGGIVASGLPIVLQKITAPDPFDKSHLIYLNVFVKIILDLTDKNFE